MKIEKKIEIFYINTKLYCKYTLDKLNDSI